MNRISAFVLNRKSNDFRLELYEHLVMMAIHEEDPIKAMKKERIVTSIEKDLKVENLPPKLINSALERLIKNRQVMRIGGRKGEKYYLSQDEKTRIELMKEQHSKTITQVQKKLGEKIRKQEYHLDLMQENMVFATFRDFLADALSSLGTECCFSLIETHGKDMQFLKPVNISEILNKFLREVEDKKLAQIEKEVFLEYISNPDDALSDFIYSLAQSYFLIQILHVDPECQKLTRESLKRTKVYLDTNVLYSSISGDKGKHNTANEVLKLTAKLGIVTVISKKTKDEFTALLGTRRRNFGRDPFVPRKRFEKTVNQFENGILKDFLQKKVDNPNLTFDRYTDRLEEIDALAKNKYSTVYDANEHKEIIERNDFPELMELVIREGNNFGLFKTEPVGEHDAFHIMLIQELRKEDDGGIIGPNYWFLTYDRSLIVVEKKFGKYEKFPSSIFVDNWIQIISPLLAPTQTKNARNVYMSLFASRLPVTSSYIDEEVYLAFQGKWMDDEDLTPKDVARIIGSRYIKDFYQRSKTASEPIKDEDKEKMIESVIADVKAQNKETIKVKAKMKELQESTKKLREEVTEWKTISKRQEGILTKLGHLFGGFLWLVLWYFLYEYFVNTQSVEHWTAFLSSMILAAGVGALADLKGYRWLLDRLFRYKTQQNEQKA